MTWDGDCGAAALIDLLQRPREDVERAMAVARRFCGAHNKEVIAAAQQLGVTLRAARIYDPESLDTAVGILRVRWTDPARAKANPDGHFVTLRGGLITCPKEGTYPWRVYLERFGGRPGSLLKNGNGSA